MGKSVAVIVGVAATLAIAIAAPMLAPMLVGAMASLGVAVSVAVASAVIATTLSVGLAYGMRALGVGAPSARYATIAPQGTAVVGMFGSSPNWNLERTMPPVQPALLRRLWWWWYGMRRFFILELVGDCMTPVVTDRFAIVDMRAAIRAGDLFTFGVKDFRAAFSHYPRDVDGVTKRFLGIDRKQRIIECDCLKPPRTINTGLDTVLWAHRVRATAPTKQEAKRLLKAVRKRPEAFDDRLVGPSAFGSSRGALGPSKAEFQAAIQQAGEMEFSDDGTRAA